MRLLVQPQMLLAMGLNLAHGFVSAYLTSYVNGTVIRLAFGRSAIGFFSALTPGSHILKHHGPTNKKLRVQLPLIVPNSGCRLLVVALIWTNAPWL